MFSKRKKSYSFLFYFIFYFYSFERQKYFRAERFGIFLTSILHSSVNNNNDDKSRVYKLYNYMRIYI